ncbi:MAG: hypothetical protein IKQ80_02020 [Clostridia bacterium]|nr:hypothetical protein [Clostridia bacterium]
MNILGVTDTRAINVTASAAGSRGKAIGLSVNANLFRRESKVDIAGGDGYAISAAKDALIEASGNDTTVMAGLALAGSTSSTAFGGNLPIVSSANTLTTTLGSGSVSAAGEAAISSHLKDRTYVIAGSIALSNAGSAVGGTALLASKRSTVKTDLGTSEVTAHGTDGKLAERVAGSPSFKGLYVGATVDNTTVTGAAGVALAGNRGVTANGVLLSSENTVEADASRAKLTSDGKWKDGTIRMRYLATDGWWYVATRKIATLVSKDLQKLKNGTYKKLGYQVNGVYHYVDLNDPNFDELKESGDVNVVAKNDVYNAVFAGGLNFGKSLGVGANVVALSSNNTVTAKAHEIDAFGDANVTADNGEKHLLINVNAGGSGKTAVELGVSVADLGNKVNAIVASEVKSRDGGFNLKANNTTDLTDVAVAVAGAGKNAVTPVFVYTGFSGETNATLQSGTVSAARGATVKADSNKTIDQYTVGASFAGQTAISGAVSIVSVKDVTNAQTAAGTDITARTLNLEAGSDYKLVGASAAVAGSGSNAVAVNGLVTVMKASTLAELGGDATATNGAANVYAHSKRDVIDVAASVAASGQNAAGITVMALVAGDRMTQDAADQLTYGSGGKEKNQKAFDASAVVNQLGKMGVNTKPMGGMADDLKGDGENMDTHVGSNGGFDVASGYTSDGVYNGGSSEKAKADETKDVKNAKKIGASARSADPKDSVTARVSSGVTVNAKGVAVKAEQETLADLFGATVGAAGSIGGGLSFTMAKLRSNVIAASLGDINANQKDVSVQAISKSGEVTPEAGSDEEARMAGAIKALGSKLNPTKRSIRAIGVAAGVGGTAGAAIAAGAVRTDNITSATLGGTITDAGKVAVTSDHKYSDILAATVGLAGGGEAGIAASIAGVGAYGTVSAKLDDDATIVGANPEVSVTTDSAVNADTVALSAAIGGGAGVAAGLSFVRNELTQNTSVDRGAKIDNTNSTNGGALTVLGKSVTTANSLLMGLSGGTVGVGIGVGVANVKPTLKTTVGVNGSGTTTLNRLGTVKVQNDVSSTANANILAVTAGVGAVGANVLLVYNDTSATAKAANVSGSMDDFTIDGQLDAAANSDAVSVAAGGVAVGVNVNYVDVNSDNTAELDADNFRATVAKKLSVTAGDEKGKRVTSAVTKSATGTAGAIAVGVNVSVARNRALNDAIITGKELNAADVTLGSYGKGTVKATMDGVSVGGIKITASVIDALNETTNRTRMTLSGALNGNLKAESKVTGETTAKLTTGGGSIVGIDTNVATAYGKTNALTTVSLGKASAEQRTVTATANGSDNVTTEIDNKIGLNAISVATMVGAAHAQDVYSAKVKLSDGDYKLTGVSVSTESDIDVKSTVTPSSSGVNLSGASVGVNSSTATSTASAGSELELLSAKLITDDDVDVKTTTSSNAEAVVKPATFSWGVAIDVGVNRVKSDLKSTQAATLRLNKGQITGAENVNVKSLVKKADSKATVSTSGADKDNKSRVKLGAVSADSNIAKANERLGSTAAVIGEGGKEATIGYNTYYNMYYRSSGIFYARITPEQYAEYQKNGYMKMAYRFSKVEEPIIGIVYDDNVISANAMTVLAGTTDESVETTAQAYTQGAAQAGLITVGNLDGEAYTNEKISAMFSGAVANVTGTAQINAAGNTKASGKGTMPGSLSLVGKGSSKMKTGVGENGDRQTVKALVGDGAKLTAGLIQIFATNIGNAVSGIEKGVSVSLASVGDSSQPTDSWYDTGVVIGDGAELTAIFGASKNGNIFIKTDAHSSASSTVSGTSVGVFLNLNTMKGENAIHDENNIDIGKRAILKTVNQNSDVQLPTGWITVTNNTWSTATAKTEMTGGGIIEGTTSTASNSITRAARINVGEYAKINAFGDIRLHLNTGAGDNIYTLAKVETDGALALGNANATTTLNSNSELHVRQGVQIVGGGVVRLQAKGTSGKEDLNNTRGIETNAVVKAHGGGINPEATAKTVLNVTNYIDVNRRNGTAGEKVTIRSESGMVNLWATNEYMHVITNANSDGKAAGGRSVAKTVMNVSLQNMVWVDDANLEAPKSKVLLEADNGDRHRAYIEAHPYGELYAAGGSVSSDIEWEQGTSFNQIRTGDRNSVKTAGSFVHNKTDPWYAIRWNLTQDIDRVTSITTWNYSEVIGFFNRYYRCDFCGDSGLNLNVTAAARAGDTAANKAFEKALTPINDIQRMVDMVNAITKARYGEEDYAAAGKLYVLDVQSALEKGVALDGERIKRYRLWNNADTLLDVNLLPNATRLYGSDMGNVIRLQYVSEVIRGDVRSNEEVHDIDIITALTAYALLHPVMPVGASGSLDFSTGMLTVPSEADFELYLHEISAKWLIEKLDEGFIQALIADQEDVNDGVLNGTELPQGTIESGLTDGGEVDGWRLYWVGDTPDTAADPDHVLIGLLVNEQTDEVDAFRTSRAMLESGEKPVDVSLYLYRDSKSDRMEIEKYNVMFFDTPEGEMSLVKIVTDVLMERRLEMPRPLKIALRAFEIDGVDFPVYSLSDHFFALCDGTNGNVSLFDGFYNNTFDGDVFDSDYIRIEGIVDGKLNVTVKPGQPVWPEWTGSDAAEDIQGRGFVRVDSLWYNEDEAPEPEPLPDDAAAA